MLWRALTLAALMLAAAPALAQERAAASLDYEVGEQLGCPSEDAFRDAVAGRLGYDPFREDAPRRIHARIDRAGPRLRGRVKVLDADGKAAGSRQLESAENECAELVSSLAMAVSILLDPLAATGVPTKPPPPAPPARPSCPACPPPRPVPCPEPEPETDPARLFAGAGLGASLGLTPGVALGPSVLVGLTWSRLSLALQGRADVTPVSPEAEGQRVTAAVFSAGPRGCGWVGVALGCVGAQAGIFQGRGVDLVAPSTQTGAFVSADVAAGLAIPLWQDTHLELLAELRAPLSRTSLLVDDQTVWTAPPLAAGLRVGLTYAFGASSDGNASDRTRP
jgi:hypothetical protein